MANRTAYGCRPKSVSQDSGCGLGCAPILCCTVPVELQCAADSSFGLYACMCLCTLRHGDSGKREYIERRCICSGVNDISCCSEIGRHSTRSHCRSVYTDLFPLCRFSALLCSCGISSSRSKLILC